MDLQDANFKRAARYYKPIWVSSALLFSLDIRFHVTGRFIMK